MSTRDDHLSHHGIKGQRWGVTNGPPYPLSYGDHNASEKSAGWQTSLKRHLSDRKLKKLERRLADEVGILTYDQNLKKTIADVKKNKENGFFKVGGTTFHVDEFKDIDDFIKADKDRIKKAKSKYEEAKKEYESKFGEDKSDGKTGLKMKKTESTADSDMKAVNPGYSIFREATTLNCMPCTAAYELRRRGYDVQAQATGHGYQEEAIEKWFPNSKLEELYKPTVYDWQLTQSITRASLCMNYDLAKTVNDKLLKQGNGARGNLMLTYDAYSGHAINYEVDNGELILRDCQTGKKIKHKKLYLSSCATAQSVRLDNVDFDPEAIKEAVK